MNTNNASLTSLTLRTNEGIEQDGPWFHATIDGVRMGAAPSRDGAVKFFYDFRKYDDAVAVAK